MAWNLAPKDEYNVVQEDNSVWRDRMVYYFSKSFPRIYVSTDAGV